jgi:hypothetical protein
MLVSVLTNHSTQPQTCLNLHCHSHPNNQSLHLDPDFIRLYLSLVPGLLYQVFVYLLAELPDRLCQLCTVRSSNPNAATVAWSGQPWARSVTTMTTMSLAVRNR